MKKAIFFVSKPIVMIGGGGHTSVLVDILREQGRDICAIISPSCINGRSALAGLVHYERDDDIHLFSPDEIELVNGIGVLPNSHLRETVIERYSTAGYKFIGVTACSAQVSRFSNLEVGVQVLHGAIIQAGSKIGAHTILNTSSVIDHDCSIGDLNHVATGARVCGGSTTGSRAFIGAGATVIQSIEIGSSSVVGAGAVVTKNIEAGGTVYSYRSLSKVDS